MRMIFLSGSKKILLALLLYFRVQKSTVHKQTEDDVFHSFILYRKLILYAQSRVFILLLVTCCISRVYSSSNFIFLSPYVYVFVCVSANCIL